MGYPAVNGAIGGSQSLAPIQIPTGQTYPPNATTNVQVDLNLDATDTSLAPATGTLTVPAPTLPTAGQTANIGGTVYTFVGSTAGLTAANTVLIGADVASTLANMAGAINASSASGQAAGTTYGTGTVANPSVTATSDATTLNLQAINSGTVGNTLPSSTPWTAGAFGAADLTGGVNVQQATGTLTVPPPLPTSGQTRGYRRNDLHVFHCHHGPKRGQHGFDRPHRQRPEHPCQFGGRHKPFVNERPDRRQNLLLGHHPKPRGPGDRLDGNHGQPDRHLMQGWRAIRMSLPPIRGAGSFTGIGDLGGGVAAIPAAATFTVPAGIVPTPGQTIDIGGMTYTFASSLKSTSPSNTVLIDPGGNVQTTLANLMAAINFDPTQIGQTYSSATTAANPSVTAFGSYGHPALPDRDSSE